VDIGCYRREALVGPAGYLLIRRVAAAGGISISPLAQLAALPTAYSPTTTVQSQASDARAGGEAPNRGSRG